MYGGVLRNALLAAVSVRSRAAAAAAAAMPGSRYWECSWQCLLSVRPLRDRCYEARRGEGVVRLAS